MFTSKQRSNLRSLAQTKEPIGQVGKGGISDNMLAGLHDALNARELIKLTVLKNSEDDALSIGRELESKLNAELVAVIGHKIILYRNNPNKKKGDKTKVVF